MTEGAKTVAGVVPEVPNDAATGLVQRLRVCSGRLAWYNLAMKAYVLYYGPDPSLETESETADEREVRLRRPPIVQYGSYPGWTLTDRFSAEVALNEITRMAAYLGDHWCEFAIDELPDGFALYCTTHTAHLALIPPPV